MTGSLIPLFLIPSLKWQWVKGHQPDKGYRKLDWWGSMNDYVDGLAKDFLQECSTGKTPRSNYTVRLLYEPWALLVNWEKTSRIDKQAVYRAVYGLLLH